MASEAQLGKKFFEEIRKSLPHPEKLVILKHSDRFTSGYPDNSLNYEGRTCWVEVKKVGGRLSPMQARYLRLLQNSCLVWLGGTSEEELKDEEINRMRIIGYLLSR